MLRLVGCLMLGAPFVAIFSAIAYQDGIGLACAVFGGSLLLMGWILAAFAFIGHQRR